METKLSPVASGHPKVNETISSYVESPAFERALYRAARESPEEEEAGEKKKTPREEDGAHVVTPCGEVTTVTAHVAKAANAKAEVTGYGNRMKILGQASTSQTARPVGTEVKGQVPRKKVGGRESSAEQVAQLEGNVERSSLTPARRAAEQARYAQIDSPSPSPSPSAA